MSKDASPSRGGVESPAPDAFHDGTGWRELPVDMGVIGRFPDAYHDGERYWMRDSGEARYEQFTKSDLERHLAVIGFNSFKPQFGLSEIDRLMDKIITKRAVRYAGPLSGHKVGMLSLPGRRILVTESVSPVQGADVPFDRLGDYFGALLGEQCIHFFRWCKLAIVAMERGDFRPGQMLIFAGPASTAKSFAQYVITQMLGGRAANPFRMMVGKTEFTEDCAQAEHLMIEDKAGSVDTRVRLNFAASIKELVVNESFNVHGKGKKAFDVPTFRRLTMSLNDTRERLQIIPPLDDDLADKVILYHCADAKRFTSEDRKENKAFVAEQLPGLVNHVMRLRVPKGEHDARFGITAWHAPTLLQAIGESEPEGQLMSIIDNALFDAERQPWTGRTSEMEAALYVADGGRYGPLLGRLFHWHGAAGSLLAKCERQHSERITSKLREGQRNWKILPPKAKLEL